MPNQAVHDLASNSPDKTGRPPWTLAVPRLNVPIHHRAFDKVAERIDG
jgi:hypothetical protein